MTDKLVHEMRAFSYIYDYLSPGVFYWVKFTAGYNKSIETVNALHRDSAQQCFDNLRLNVAFACQSKSG